MYEYTATVLRVVDGDTVHLEVDLGFDIKRRDTFRLYGINAPEMNTEAGLMAKEWLIQALFGRLLVITTRKDKREKYGRYLATLWIDKQNINLQMVEEGHAVAYMT